MQCLQLNMCLFAILLMTHVEMFEVVRLWAPIVISLGTFFYMLNRNSNKELSDSLKQEKAQLNERLSAVEKVQEKNVPKFNELCDSVKQLNDVVSNKHELRFTGIVADVDRLKDSNEIRFTNNEKMVDGVMKKIDKLEDKIDKIMDEILKLNAK